MVTNAIETHRGEIEALSGPVTSLLRELLDVLGKITPEQYQARCGEQFFDGAVGGHVRHCLDHVRALVDGIAAGAVDYDHRERGTNVESDPIAAHSETSRLIEELEGLGGTPCDRPLKIELMPTRNGRSARVNSTLGRELAFVLSHTIHHNAIVKSMAYALGVSFPRSFGYAPSTLAHQDGCSCAP